MKNHPYPFLFLFLIVLFAFSCSEEPPPLADQSLIDVFIAEEEVPELVLHTSLPSLTEQKTREYQTAELRWPGKDTFQIEVKTRGKTRNKICAFPPLKLRFSATDVEKYKLFPARTLKLVTHCVEDSSLVLKEYLAYKIYNTLTEKSFKVQLIKLRYVDEHSTMPSTTHYAFLLEHHNALAHRLGGRLMKDKKVKTVAQNDYHRLAIFQYMIGNTDWNISRYHNIKLIQTAAQSAPIPVPYDFDYSGLIDAPYAQPHPNLPIDDVKERFFQWRGKDVARLEAQLSLVVQHKKTIMRLCNQFPLLNGSERTSISNYLDAFFVTAEQAIADDNGTLAGIFDGEILFS
ncbi:MAG: hypothetical protein AAF798_03205 [Bacteroidota bacterium]